MLQLLFQRLQDTIHIYSEYNSSNYFDFQSLLSFYISSYDIIFNNDFISIFPGKQDTNIRVLHKEQGYYKEEYLKQFIDTFSFLPKAFLCINIVTYHEILHHPKICERNQGDFKLTIQYENFSYLEGKYCSRSNHPLI